MFFLKVGQRRCEKSNYIGPFGSRKAAEDFAERLEARDKNRKDAGAVKWAFPEEMTVPSTLESFSGVWEDHSFTYKPSK